MGRKINIIENLDGKKTVLIQDTMFKGRRTICWGDVEKYLDNILMTYTQLQKLGKKFILEVNCHQNIQDLFIQGV